MCGIAGIVNLAGRLTPATLRDTADQMASKLTHRGPDDHGTWVDDDGYCALVHRRLSIIDVSPAGRQPMSTPDNRHVLTYNGELYNFKELRETLSAKGMSFRSQTDTEVFLAGLASEGAHFLTRADGMFALAWYDQVRKELVLGRDPFGEKPVYYTVIDGIFAFASELHALALVPGFDPGISVSNLAKYLAFQHIPAPDTIYDSCKKLPPGHYLRVGVNGLGSPTRYFHFLTHSEPTSQSLDDAADNLEELLLASVRRRLISDVPLGAFLSAGVDSSTVVALVAKRLNRSIQTFSIGFKDTVDSEHVFAQTFADYLGTEHQTEFIDPSEYPQWAEVAMRMDEPNADSSCAPTFLVSQLARKSVTVALTGDGADELFAGYGRYLACVTATAGREEDIQARRWHIGREYYSRHSMLFDDQDICQFFGFLPSHAADAILQRRRRIDLDVRPVIHRLREADVETYMPVVLAKVDRMSMLHSLETRTPYLSPEIANFAARLPVSFLYNDVYGKLVLRKVMSRYFPIDFVDRPKKGFGIDSFHATALPALLRRVERELSPPDCALASYVPHEKVLHFIRNCLPTMTVYHSWAVLILELWLRSHPNKPTFENSLMDS